MIQWMLAIWPGSSAFSKSSLNIWKFTVYELWSLAWRILSITLLACEMSAIVCCFVHSLALLFLRSWMKIELFQSCVHCCFPNLLVYECSSFAASSFRIWKLNWNSITSTSFIHSDAFYGHLTPHSRMSGSRWVIIPSWLSESWRSFFVQFCVFLPPLLNIFCFC